MKKELFGILPNGQEIYEYTLTNGKAICRIMNLGAAILSLQPFGDVNVIGGFDTLEEYLQDDSNQGLIIGRVANRVKNAVFEMEGWEYHLIANDNGNCLHSGIGFGHRVWQVAEYTENTIILTYSSPDMEDGFPAKLDVEVTYTLENNALHIGYKAIPHGKTPIALTNHAYFNLDGFGGTVDNHTVQIYANRYTHVDDLLIPTGHRPLVEGTGFDFRTPRTLADAKTGKFGEVDHNLILAPETFKEFMGKSLGLAAEVSNQTMEMKMYTDQPGVQFYTGNFLGNGPAFAGGHPQVQHGGFCLEAQTEPNCITRGEAIYKKGDIYTQLTVYEFMEK